MYIDESGNTATLQEKGSNILVLTGCIIHEQDKHSIEQEFRDIKQKYYYNPNIEIKSNFLRYANPDIKDINSPIRLKDRARYDPIFHVFEYGKGKKEYWRFADITDPKLIDLKFFPEETKKNFKFYQ